MDNTTQRKTKKPYCHFWRAETKARSWEQPEGWADHLTHPSGPTPGHTPILIPYKEPARSLQLRTSKQGNLLLVLAPPTPPPPMKPCLNYLSGFQSVSIDSGGQESWLVTPWPHTWSSPAHVVVQSLSVWLFATLWTVACQAPQSLGFPRPECWSGVPFPSPEDFPNLEIKAMSPALAGEFFTTGPPN